jgi:hypothetical protein
LHGAFDRRSAFRQIKQFVIANTPNRGARAQADSINSAPRKCTCVQKEIDVSKSRWLRQCGWVVILALAGSAVGAFSHVLAGPLVHRVGHHELCVTNGMVSALRGGQFAIETPSSRAVVRNAAATNADQIAEIRFRYLGPGWTSRPLASGELRRQIGLKLRAADSCNLVYAMWRIAPQARIVVSVKSNAGMHSHAQCGAHGYRSIEPQVRFDPPPIRPGEVRTLRAELHGAALTVSADGKVVWQGMLAEKPPAGPMGFRSDNGRFVIEHFAAGPMTRLHQPPTAPGGAHCALSAGD